MDLGLTGTTVVVTGAGRGIGLATVRAFVREGARVVAGSRTATDDLTALAEDGVEIVVVDLASPDGPAELVAAAGPDLGALVDNVGFVHPRPDGFTSVTDEMWEQTLGLDLLSHVRTLRAALPVMVARGGGSIVTIGSVNAALPDPLVVDYSAAKAAQVSLTKAIAQEYGARGVRANSINPGPVATDLWLGAGGVADVVGAATGQDPAAVQQGAAGASATGRFTRPEEVADLAVVLASGRWPNLTGAGVTIDGGLVPTL
ncbi:SDR family NAD(P)-dependent oxidoreductase [Nocardioides mangrovi]|uniref:SDR family oxidoreductase n=1 Tax=Nocardioides mangrovi TaxID=2874580 RepID=A0ABS7U920_9ACTN|nr:SDR family oxidoreductase [Nocardioides mangrovi]MBZ5737471.1 SDR family oxidoreductase [Nocardioides mangrovi]